MQIVCQTSGAASQVMQILMLAGLRVSQEFSFDDPYQPNPPIHITVHVDLLSSVVSQVLRVPGTSVELVRHA